MLTFDNFKTIFHRAKKTQWVLYKGSTKGQQIGSNLSESEISWFGLETQTKPRLSSKPNFESRLPAFMEK